MESVSSLAVRVPLRDAEAARRRLVDEGFLRTDLALRKESDALVFPVSGTPDGFEVTTESFSPRQARVRHYTELLDWSPEDKALAPRAFDQMGDIVVLKVPDALWDRREALGEAILTFLPAARAVFHDRGVVGEFRTRDLVPLAGSGSAETTITENGFRLRVDVSQAYFSPRLGDERARIVGLCKPGERVIDLFGGVAPLGVQLARRGVEVVSIDLNPEAIRLAKVNAELNKVQLTALEGDARAIAAKQSPAHHVVMNLPHGAKHFLDVAAKSCAPSGTVHYHEIMLDADVEARKASLVSEFQALGRTAAVTHVRHVRAYSPIEGHYAFDILLETPTS